MAKYLIEDSTLTAISNAIRTKTGKSELLKPSQWAVELDDIKVSGKYLWSKKKSADGDVIGYAVADDFAKYPDGGMQDGYYWTLCIENAGPSFTIDGQKFNFDSGMYWSDWLISDYNTIDAEEEEVEFIPGMYRILSSGGFVLYNSSGEQVSPADEIIENEAYAWK